MKKPDSIVKLQKLYPETDKNTKERILEVFYAHPDKEFSLSDLAKEAKVAKTNIGHFLNQLLRVGFIQIIKLKTIWQIKPNRQNTEYLKNKILYNLHTIYKSGLLEFLDERYHHPKAIVLFGSFRKGEDVSGSDIDIAIETNDINGYVCATLNELAELEQTINRTIQIHLFNRKGIDPNIFNNIANGILLKGFLEVKP